MTKRRHVAALQTNRLVPAYQQAFVVEGVDLPFQGAGVPVLAGGLGGVIGSGGAEDVGDGWVEILRVSYPLTLAIGNRSRRCPTSRIPAVVSF
jgi:hypothetical protein